MTWRGADRVGPGQLIAELRHQGIGDDAVLRAIATVRRDAFVDRRHRSAAWGNHPLPIGSGQTISQPFIVALMTQVLRVGQGDVVLDVGTGCGYQAAVLAALGCEVHGIEVLPELAALARQNLSGQGFQVDVVVGDGRRGRPEHAPYDGIVVAAASDDVPAELLRQLRPPTADRPGGRLVIPLVDSGGIDAGGQELVMIERTSDGYVHSDVERVRFVPLV